MRTEHSTQSDLPLQMERFQDGSCGAFCAPQVSASSLTQGSDATSDRERKPLRPPSTATFRLPMLTAIRSSLQRLTATRSSLDL